MAHLDHELLSAYIDTELSPDDMQQVERHLAECETCQREYAELRGIATMVRELPTYLPRRAIKLDEPARRPPSGTMAQIMEFAKPLAVAALILLVAFAGLRLVVDNEEDNGEEGQISFSAVQEPTPDGTIPADAALEPPAASNAARSAAVAPAEQDGEAAAPIEEDSEEASELAPGAVEREPAQATVTPAAPAETEPADDDGGSRYLLIGALGVITVLVALSAARYAFRSSPKRPRT